MGVVGATIAAGVASAAVGSGISALSSSKQSGNVAGNQQQVQNQLMNLQPQFDTALANETAAYQPYSTTGLGALSTAGAVAGPTPQTVGGATDVGGELAGIYGPDAASSAMAGFQTSPGYQFALQQGERGVDAGAAAAGMLRSGATLKAENTYAQGMADQQFNTYETNANTAFGNYYKNLAGLAGGGLTAAGGIRTANQDYVANMAGNVEQSNTALTGATNAQNSILGNEAQGLTGTANTLLNNPGVQTGINNLFGGNNTVSNSTVAANALYQQQQFGAANPGVFGPFQ